MNTSRREQRKRTSPTDLKHAALAQDRSQEEAQKSYHTILEQHVQQAQEELERPAKGLLLSGFSAGMDLGFGPLLMAVVLTLTRGEFSRATTDLLIANAYAVGFIFVVIGRSALFTEQTTSAVMPILARRAKLYQLFRLWGLVLAANLVGATVISALIAVLGPALGVVQPPVLSEIAGKLLEKPWWVTLLSAVVAGWLMGLLSWLVIAARDTVSQILLVWLITFVIGVATFHHSIAGTVEVLMALFAGTGPTFADYGKFIAWAVLGNAVGGAMFVALLKFGHVLASTEP